MQIIGQKLQHGYDYQITETGKGYIHPRQLAIIQKRQQVHNIIYRNIREKFILDIAIGETDQSDKDHGYYRNNFQARNIECYRSADFLRQKAHKAVNPGQGQYVCHNKDQRIADIGTD